jgi:hypothetical protein
MEPDRHNPFVAHCEAHGWFLAEQATVLGIPGHALRALHAGRASLLKEQYRAGMEAAGYDFDAWRAAYGRWHEQRARVGVLPSSVDLTALPDTERAIVQALRQGIRGESAIARAAEVPRCEVVRFLRSGPSFEAVYG